MWRVQLSLLPLPTPPGTRLAPFLPSASHHRAPPPPAHLRAGRLACLLLCQRGPSYHGSRSHLASQDFSSQDVYLERNPSWVLLTHTLVALPGSQGSGPMGWPPAICGLSVETAAWPLGSQDGPTSEPAESPPRGHLTNLCGSPALCQAQPLSQMALPSCVSRSRPQ